jgi:tRNA G18 (ribose-2'-O)-methylase SpoU
MTPEQIISYETGRKGMNSNAILAKLRKHIHEHDANLLQKHDTLMYLNRIDDHNADVHFISMDAPLILVKSIAYFLDLAKKHGIKVLHTSSKNPKVMQALKANHTHIMQSPHHAAKLAIVL